MNGLPGACERHADALAELALGILGGRARAEVLAHLGSCRSCSEQVEQLSRAADELLQVAPAVDPPAGFEARLLDRMDARRAEAPPRRRALVVAAIAAAVLAIAGLAVALGVVATGARPPAPVNATGAASQAALVGAAGAPAGRAVTSAGSPPWLFMVVDSPALSGRLTCEIVLASGQRVTLGSFSVHDGYATWSSPLTVAPASLRRAQLIDADGSVVASATFPSRNPPR